MKKRKNILAVGSAVILSLSMIAQPWMLHPTPVEASYNITINVPSTSSFRPDSHGKVQTFGTCGSDTLEYYLYEDGVLYIRNTDHSGEDKTLIQVPVGDDYTWKEYATSVYIEAGVYGISEGVFADCSKLTSVTYSADSLVVPQGAFAGCMELTQVTSKDTVFPYKPATFPEERSINYCAYDKVTLTIQNQVLKEFDISSYRGSAPKEVVLPYGITEVADNAIQDETGIIRLTFPESVTKIGAGNMDGCTSLATIDFPSSLKEIGGKICQNTAWLTEQFKNSDFAIVNHILVGTNASAKNGMIPDGVTEIASEVFQGITLTSLTLPSSVKKIHAGAFESCHCLGTISFSEGLEEIGDFAFYGCSGLVTVEFPDSLKTIGKQAFYLCSELQNVTKPDTLSYASPDAFDNTPWIHKYDISTKVVNGVLIGYGEIANTIRVPDQVTSMEAGYIDSYDDIVNIVIPDSVTYIRDDTFLGEDTTKSNILINANKGSYAFNYAKEHDLVCCPNSTSLDFGKVGIMVKHGYFSNGTGWILFKNNILYIYADSIKAPDTNVIKCVEPFHISDFDSENGSLLENVETVWIEDGLTEIAPNSLDIFTNLKVIRVADSVSRIGEQSLQVDIASFIVTGSRNSMAKSFSETLGSYCIDSEIGFEFAGHKTIRAVVACGEDMYFIRYYDYAMLIYGNGQMYDGWNEHKYGNVYYYSRLFKNYEIEEEEELYEYEQQRVLYIDSSVTYIGENGLQDLHNYTVKYFSPNITHFGIRACYGLGFDVPVVLNKDVEYWGGASFAVTGMKSFDASNISCSKLPVSCFAYADQLTDLKLPQGLTEISDFAFMETTFREFEIPEGVTRIGDYAFERCMNLESIVMPSSLISVGQYVFNDCHSLASVDFSKAKDIQKVGRICFTNTPYLEQAMKENSLVINGNVLINAQFTKDVVTIPEGVTVIADSAFTFVHPNGYPNVENYDEVVEQYKISKIIFPSTLKYIGDYAFSHREADSFANLQLPDGLCTIGKYAFFNCPVYESSIPSSVYDIGYGAFKNVVGNFWLSQESVITLCHPTIPELEGCAFSNHFLLDTTYGKQALKEKDVSFPKNSGLTAIAGGAFQGYIKNLTLPASITMISSEAFYDLIDLETLTVYGDVTYLGEDLFWKDSKVKTIYAKKGSLLETYAIEHGLEFIPLDGQKKGDVDGDSKVTLADAQMILKAALRIISLESDETADVNGDGQVTLEDAQMALKIALKIDVEDGI